ncbi:hypothetical protein QBC35DRAFT_259059 [Podospora australis]|uniref:Major facilitator superfamily (MFS) profile domain-containing protein n=1 Tax=Podospora australis TaxID=1536484 RepID=A0AAN6X194_9PEZI|nr:hypothetical protein QBC35DRAFT_259059 [Podospora australis]
MATEKPSITSLGSGSGSGSGNGNGNGSEQRVGEVVQTQPAGPEASSDVENLTSSSSQDPTPRGPGRVPPHVGGEQYNPRTIGFWVTMACNFLALFLVALDRTIVATAVPRISDEFQALADVGWYGSSYMLTTACAQLVFGRIYKFYDIKWTFFTSIIVFEVGSAICGAAPNSAVFILGRAIAGLGSAGIFSGSLLIMIPMVPLHRRPQFQSLFGAVFGIASVIGPLLGGAFTGGVSWRWCFYINLPIGAVSMVLLWIWLNPPKNDAPWPPTFLGHMKRLDPLGMFFFMPGVVCLFIAFQWGGSTYEWSEWRIILLFVVFAVCTAAFITVQKLWPESASIPGRIIKQRSVFFGTVFTFFLSGSMLMLVYYLPMWFQTVKQVDPVKSGVYTLPLVLSLVVSSIASGQFTQKIGYYVPSMITAPILMSIGEGLLSTLDRDSPPSHWVSYQFLSGFGLGFGMQTSGLAIQAVLPKPDISQGVALNFFVQQLGGAVFTAVGQTILTNLLVAELTGVAGLTPKDIVGEGATKLAHIVPPAYHGVIIEAYNYACRHIFLASMALAFMALLSAMGMEWINIKKGKNGPPGPPGQRPGPPAADAPIELSSPATLASPAVGKPFFEGAKRHSKSSSVEDSIAEQKSKDGPKDDKRLSVLNGERVLTESPSEGSSPRISGSGETSKDHKAEVKVAPASS